MFTHHFGVEVELTGITREKAAVVVAGCLNEADIETVDDYYDTYKIKARDGRAWKIMYDGSINYERKENGEKIPADRRYSVELVSPILTYYDDILLLQQILRKLRYAGGFTNPSCGIHIHLDGSDHTARSISNFINLIASRNDLFYKALRIRPERMRYCQKMDEHLVKRLGETHPQTLAEIENIWYKGYQDRRNKRYHRSRYHFLNLHSFFHGHHTVELRGFNGTLHAGKVRAYIVFALALNHQALTQKSARCKTVQAENERFAMRTYLCRLGLNGDEFKSCREHLCQHLDGNSAWRFGSRENVHRHIGNGSTGHA